MNEVRRISPYQDQIDRVRAIVAKHLRPDLVSDFSVDFGRYEDEPAMWVTFDTVGPRPKHDDKEGRQARAERLRQFKDAVHDELIAEFQERYPYYRFVENLHQG